MTNNLWDQFSPPSDITGSGPGMEGEVDTPYYVSSPETAQAAAPPIPATAPATAPTSLPTETLPDLPSSGGIFNVPILGPILDTARDLLVGPGAQRLSTQEQVTRGMLNTLVLAKNPGAMPVLRQGYAAADATASAEYMNPAFRDRVVALSDKQGPFKLSEERAIARAAAEYNIDKGLARPKTLTELPSIPYGVQDKYTLSQLQHEAYGTVLSKKETDYPGIGNKTPREQWIANRKADTGIPLTPEDQEVLTLQAQARMNPDLRVKDITYKPGLPPQIKLEPQPHSFVSVGNGLFMDQSTGAIYNAAGQMVRSGTSAPGGSRPSIGGPPTTPPAPGLAIQPQAVAPTPGMVAPVAPAPEVAAPVAAAPIAAQPAPTSVAAPLALDDKLGRTAAPPGQPYFTEDRGQTTTNSYMVKFMTQDMQGNIVEASRFKTDEELRADATREAIRSGRVQSSAELYVQRLYSEAVSKRDLVQNMVGEYTIDPATGFPLDRQGKPIPQGNPDNQIPAGTGMHQFLHKGVFSNPIVEYPTGFVGDFMGAGTSSYYAGRQFLRQQATLDPKNFDLVRYEAYINERVPAYLIAAGVTRTTQTEINLLKQAFPNPRRMPLALAIAMADQLPGIMEARARVAAKRLKQVQNNEPPEDYPDIVLNANGTPLTIQGGGAPLTKGELQDTEGIQQDALEERNRLDSMGSPGMGGGTSSGASIQLSDPYADAGRAVDADTAAADAYFSEEVQ